MLLSATPLPPNPARDRAAPLEGTKAARAFGFVVAARAIGRMASGRTTGDPLLGSDPAEGKAGGAANGDEVATRGEASTIPRPAARRPRKLELSAAGAPGAATAAGRGATSSRPSGVITALGKGAELMEDALASVARGNLDPLNVAGKAPPRGSPAARNGSVANREASSS